MVSTATMSKTNRKIFSWVIARRKGLAAWALLVSPRRWRTHHPVTLGKLPVTPFKPAAAPQAQEPSRLGLTVAPAAAIKGAGNQGVAITDVDPNGLAAEKGLEPGDIILDVSHKPVRTPADVHNAINRAQESGTRDILMRAGRGTTEFNLWRSPFPLRDQLFGVGSRVGSIRCDACSWSARNVGRGHSLEKPSDQRLVFEAKHEECLVD
jgi:membrane-associated protease RseP (regulator of RpoE activity)